jgi:hypothetical protein
MRFVKIIIIYLMMVVIIAKLAVNPHALNVVLMDAKSAIHLDGN